MECNDGCYVHADGVRDEGGAWRTREDDDEFLICICRWRVARQHTADIWSYVVSVAVLFNYLLLYFPAHVRKKLLTSKKEAVANEDQIYVRNKACGRNSIGRNWPYTLFMVDSDCGMQRSAKQWPGCNPWPPECFYFYAAKDRVTLFNMTAFFHHVNSALK